MTLSASPLGKLCPRCLALQVLRTAEYLTARAVDFIRAHKGESFLVQVAQHAVHIPLATKPELLASLSCCTIRQHRWTATRYTGTCLTITTARPTARFGRASES